MALPTAKDLRDLLTVAREMGATEVSVTPEGGFSVKLGPERTEVEPATPFRDKDGKPVDLDEGMPWNARDPIAEKNFEQPKS